MRAGALAILASLLLSGCAEYVDFGNPAAFAGAPDSGPRARASDVYEAALEAGRAWNPAAVLLTVTSDAHAPRNNPFKRPEPAQPILADGRMTAWKFNFAVPATVAMASIEISATGELLDTKRLDLSKFAPDVGPYGEYFEMTPVNASWLETDRLVDLVLSNASLAPIFSEDVESMSYALDPDVRDLYVWKFKVTTATSSLTLEVNPSTWEIYELTAEGTVRARVQTRVADRTPSGLAISQVFGYREEGEDALTRLSYWLETAPGARPIDLSKLVVERRAADGAVTTWTHVGERTFALDRVRGSGPPNVLGSGDLVTLDLVLDEGLPPRGEAALTFFPERGSPLAADVKAPNTFGRNQAIQLR